MTQAVVRVVAIPNRVFPPPTEVLARASVVLGLIKELDPDVITEVERLSTASSG